MNREPTTYEVSLALACIAMVLTLFLLALHQDDAAAVMGCIGVASGILALYSRNEP